MNFKYGIYNGSKYDMDRHGWTKPKPVLMLNPRDESEGCTHESFAFEPDFERSAGFGDSVLPKDGFTELTKEEFEKAIFEQELNRWSEGISHWLKS